LILGVVDITFLSLEGKANKEGHPKTFPCGKISKKNLKGVRDILYHNFMTSLKKNLNPYTRGS